MSSKPRINDIALQKWRTDVFTHKNCLNYRIFKENLTFEKYLCTLKTLAKIHLCKFRCGIHKLPISNKRFDENAAIKCKLCEKGDFGDEYHYVLVCPFCNTARKRHLQKYYYNNPSTLTFSKLFQLTDITKLVQLAKYVKIIMDMFED